MEYQFYIWTFTPKCYLDISDHQQKQNCGTVGSTFPTSPERLAHRRNTTYLSPLYSSYFVRCSTERAELVFLSFSLERCNCHSDTLCDHRCYNYDFL